MIAQEFQTAQIIQVAQPANPNPEQQLEDLAEETLFFDEDVSSLIEMCEGYFKVRDRGNTETALELKKELISRIKLIAMGAGITKEILDQHYRLRAA